MDDTAESYASIAKRKFQELYYGVQNFYDDHEFGIKTAGTIAGVAAAIGVVIFTLEGITTREWNPVNQVKAKIHASRRYHQLYDELLDKADADKNGVLSFAEQADLWRRMGYADKIVLETAGVQQFQKPTLKGLEKAVESYK